MSDPQDVILDTLSSFFKEDVYPNDMYIELGGNSITALALKDQLAEKGVQVSIDVILSEPISTWRINSD